jgi:capsular polysaccharide biosynthesis protein
MRLYKTLKRPLLPYRNFIKRWWNRGRRRLAESVRRFAPYGKNFPDSFCASTKQWQEDTRNTPLKSEYVEIDAPLEVHYTLPQEPEPTLHWEFASGADYRAHATFCAAIPRGRVWGASGTVISPDNRLLADLSEEFGIFAGDPRNHSLFRQWKLPPLQFVKGSVAVLAAPGGFNYFHWMFDVLPRLDLLRTAFPEKKVDLYLVNSPPFPFQIETLGKLGISQTEVTGCTASTFIEAEELLAPSLQGGIGRVSRRSCDFLRRHFGPPQDKSNAKRRLYISRKSSIYRRVIDEEKLAATLQEYGFETLSLEDMTVAQQALAFSEAEAVVGPHGAGFANLVFCERGAKVIEIFSPQYVSPCSWTLASQVGLPYFYVLGMGMRPPENVNPNSSDADISIDYIALRNKLETAGIERVG